MSVSDGNHITLIQEDRAAIEDGDTIQLGVVGLTQRNNVDRSIVALNLKLCVLSADNRKLDLDVTSFGPPKQKFLVSERKGGKDGSVCAAAPRHLTFPFEEVNQAL